MKQVWISEDSFQTILFGEKIGRLLKPNDVILLIGDLACGKTTMTKGIGKSLGVRQVINSPTFTIVKEYEGSLPLYHLDLYRLDGIQNDFDLEEYFDKNGVCVVEWPYQVKELLPKEYLKIEMERMDESRRKITLQGVGQRYEELIAQLGKETI